MSKAKEVFLTEEGLEEIKVELEELIKVKRPANIQALQEARAQGDLSENAEYDSARDEQAIIEGKIQELEAMLENVKIIEHHNTGKIELGSIVEIEYVKEKEKEIYTVVGSAEADPFNNKISNESPIVKAIMGKKKGDTVTVISPASKYDVKIVSVK